MLHIIADLGDPLPITALWKCLDDKLYSVITPWLEYIRKNQTQELGIMSHDEGDYSITTKYI